MSSTEEHRILKYFATQGVEEVWGCRGLGELGLEGGKRHVRLTCILLLHYFEKY